MTSGLTGKPGPDRQPAVQPRLGRCRSDSDRRQDLRQVVRDDTVTNPLGIETDTEEQIETLLVPPGPEEGQVGSTSSSSGLCLNGRLHLLEFVSTMSVGQSR